MEDGGMISLDAIIDYVLEGDSGESPKFVRDCERKVRDRLLDYTGKIRQAAVERTTTGEEADTLVEENAGSLLDSICVSNRAYMKKGMKLGAWMIFQMLGL